MFTFQQKEIIEKLEIDAATKREISGGCCLSFCLLWAKERLWSARILKTGSMLRCKDIFTERNTQFAARHNAEYKKTKKQFGKEIEQFEDDHETIKNNIEIMNNEDRYKELPDRYQKSAYEALVELSKKYNYIDNKLLPTVALIKNNYEKSHEEVKEIFSQKLEIRDKELMQSHSRYYQVLMNEKQRIASYNPTSLRLIIDDLENNRCKLLILSPKNKAINDHAIALFRGHKDDRSTYFYLLFDPNVGEFIYTNPESICQSLLDLFNGEYSKNSNGLEIEVINLSIY